MLDLIVDLRLRTHLRKDPIEDEQVLLATRGCCSLPSDHSRLLLGLNFNLLVIGNRELLLNCTERVSRATICFEIVCKNRPRPDEYSNVSLILEVAVEELLLVGRVDRVEAGDHLLLLFLKISDHSLGLGCATFQLTDPVTRLLNLCGKRLALFLLLSEDLS